MTVPNLFPIQPSPLRIALVGEAPGKEDCDKGQPFVGASGFYLSKLLAKCGTTREACFLGNISQHRPLDNNISLFKWDGPEIQSGMAQLATDLERYRPNVVVCLGNVPLKAAKDPLSPRGKHDLKVSQWRGSLFLGHDNGPFAGCKCLATLHPAYCLRDFDQMPLLGLDLRKAVRESRSPELKLPKTDFIIPCNLEAASMELARFRSEKKLLSVDIEGGLFTMSCIGLSSDPRRAVIIPFFRRDYSSWWTAEEELVIWRQLAALLEDPAVPKCLQNSLYDRFVLHYSYGIRMQGVREDTMLKHWELNSELEKNLGVQTSIYTDVPYYKSDRKSNDDVTFFEYCGQDAAVTLEICQALDVFLTAECSRRHYYLNVELLNPLLSMELQGISYAHGTAALRQLELQRQLYAAQARLNAMSGHGFRWDRKGEVFEHARALMGFKRATILSWDALSYNCKKDYQPVVKRLRDLLATPNPGLPEMGEVENLCEVSLNLGSNKQMAQFLYEELKLPTQYAEQTKHEKAAFKPPSATADYEALLKLAKLTQDDPGKHAFIDTCIEIRALETRQRMLGISADEDGRIRCGYNIVGSNTGRITCYESPTGSGYNLQTIPNYTSKQDAPGGVLGDRDLFLADPDHWFFQCDLKGADGWTVAAYCAMLGDSTMLDDYRASLKPYQIVACKLRGYPANFQDRDDLRGWCKKIEKDAWDGFACKRVQHGKAYLEGDLTVSRNILKDSEGKLYMSPAECKILGQFYLERYWGIPKWHQWIANIISKRPVLCAASGQIRTFNGRPDEILTKAVAFEPQANTTYATNLAMQKLWTDPENRIISPSSSSREGNVSLRIEPLHQVHDALCGQFLKVDTTWAVAKIKSYFANPLTIAGQQITIPFDGAYGESWGNTKEGVI